MSTNSTESTTFALCADPGGDPLLEPLSALPEPDALKYYAELSPKLQWVARQRATGQRRAALILYHALEIAQIK
jgi:hypothetical protein